MRVGLATKGGEILHLKMKNQQLSFEGPSTVEALATEYAELQTKVAALTKEVRRLNIEVKDLTKKLMNSHVVESAIWRCCSSLSP